MRITPLDVRKQEFRRSVRGLDPDEVHAFLATVADEYEAVLTDNKQLREKVIELDEKVTEYRNMERTLRDTLITAERVMTEARQNARKEAELILRDAELKAEQQTANIAQRVEALRTQLRELRGHRDSYLARLQSLSEAQIGLVESYRRDFQNEDREARDLMSGGKVTRGNPTVPARELPEDEDDAGEGFEVDLSVVEEEDQSFGGPSTPTIGESAQQVPTGDDHWRRYSLRNTDRREALAASPVAPRPSDPAPPVDTRVDALDRSTGERPAPADAAPEIRADDEPEWMRVASRPAPVDDSVDRVARAVTDASSRSVPSVGGQSEGPMAPYGGPGSGPTGPLPWEVDPGEETNSSAGPERSEPFHVSDEDAEGEASQERDGSKWSLSRFTKGLANF